MREVLNLVAVKLLRILGLCTPWRRPIALDGNPERVRSVLSQVMRVASAPTQREVERHFELLTTARTVWHIAKCLLL